MADRWGAVGPVIGGHPALAIVTWQPYERLPMPTGLIGTTEIAELVGVSRQRVNYLAFVARSDLPGARRGGDGAGPYHDEDAL